MNLGAHKTVITIAGLVMAFIIITGFISSIWPKQEEMFIEFGLLGKNKTADEYFSNDSSAVEVDIQALWHIYVHNHMASDQRVSVRAKLLNSAMEMPNDLEHKPSSSDFFIEFLLSLSADETLFVEFLWQVSEIVKTEDSTIIRGLVVDGQEIEVNVPASDNVFNMIFELWVYNPSSHEYEYKWESKNELFSASLNMEFSVAFPED